MTDTQTEAKKTVVLGKFNGALGGFQASAFLDLKAGGFEPEVAHKIAFDYGSDLGNAIRNAGDDGLASKVAKAKKGGDSRISVSGGGSTKTSRSMSVIRLCQQLDNLYKENLLPSRKVEAMSETLTEYITDCEAWASEQEFANS